MCKTTWFDKEKVMFMVFRSGAECFRSSVSRDRPAILLFTWYWAHVHGSDNSPSWCSKRHLHQQHCSSKHCWQVSSFLLFVYIFLFKNTSIDKCTFIFCVLYKDCF